MSILLRLSCSLDRRPEPLISKIIIEANNKEVNIDLIPNDLGQNLDLEKWSLSKAILLIKKIKDVDINIL
jgi:exopolyphosphatase/guanosine-5'-triphosphate,3'-diphosphate pyrophosphatase